MLRSENFNIYGIEAAIRGMRNPLNSWEKSDSGYGCDIFGKFTLCEQCDEDFFNRCKVYHRTYWIGHNDFDLMKRLFAAGKDHRKFLRMVTISMDITAPLYWWKEFDTYKVGTVANSCSTMHTIHKKPFELSDFSFEKLLDDPILLKTSDVCTTPERVMEGVCAALNTCRDLYLETTDKKYWWQLIQMLPSSYNQKRTVTMSLETFFNIYESRKAHKLDEWISFCYFGVYNLMMHLGVKFVKLDDQSYIVGKYLKPITKELSNRQK